MMKYTTIFLLLLFMLEAFAQEKIKVYNRNMSNDFVRESIENLASLSHDKFGEYSIVSSSDMEINEAFEALVKGEIDIFVGAPTLAREQAAPMIYIPIDRGLLGFRLCLVHKNTKRFKSIRNVSDFIDQELTVGLGRFWPDRDIFLSSGFKVASSPIFEELFAMLNQQQFDCLTRSVMEIDYDLQAHKDLDIEIDQELVMIYPNADFIFVNPNKNKLKARFEHGFEQAIDNYSYYEIFDKHFYDALQKHQVYERKLIFLNVHDMSQNTIKAINRHGIASFIIE